MTTEAVATRDPLPVIQLDDQKIALIKRTIAKGATDDELQLFISQCRRTGLDPFARQIYCRKQWDSREGREVMSIGTSIDGFRVVAERTGKYVGQLGPFWCGKDGVWHDVWLHAEPPFAAKVGALRSDFKEPLWGTARYATYCQRKKDGSPTHTWFTMPDLMLGKCAEALALRRAFPQDLSGLYTSDEMGAVGNAAPPDLATPPPPSPVAPDPKDVTPPTEAELPSVDQWTKAFGDCKDLDDLKSCWAEEQKIHDRYAGEEQTALIRAKDKRKTVLMQEKGSLV